jgi:AcrR family transcriptional regulator
MPPEQATLSAIGAELGVTGPALYRYFPVRTAILEALAHEARETLVPPDPALAWDQWLREAARKELALWRTHADLYEAASYRAIARPSVRMFRVGMEVLEAAGFSTVDAICGLTAVTELAHTFGWSEGKAELLLSPQDAAELRESMAGLDEPLTPDLVFERTIAITVDGLRSRLASPRSRKRTTTRS